MSYTTWCIYNPTVDSFMFIDGIYMHAKYRRTPIGNSREPSTRLAVFGFDDVNFFDITYPLFDIISVLHYEREIWDMLHLVQMIETCGSFGDHVDFTTAIDLDIILKQEKEYAV